MCISDVFINIYLYINNILIYVIISILFIIAAFYYILKLLFVVLLMLIAGSNITFSLISLPGLPNSVGPVSK